MRDHAKLCSIFFLDEKGLVLKNVSALIIIRYTSGEPDKGDFGQVSRNEKWKSINH